MRRQSTFACNKANVNAGASMGQCIERRLCKKNEDPYNYCEVDETIFSVEVPKKQCLLSFETECIIGPSGPIESCDPVCCNCGDKIQIIGLNGVNVAIDEEGCIVMSLTGA